LIVAALAVVALASARGAPPVDGRLHRAPALPTSSAGVRALREGELLDLNRAAAGDLVLLPGVGPKLAERIVAERSRRGGFTRAEQLLEVKGIGQATLKRLAPFIRIEPGYNKSSNSDAVTPTVTYTGAR
jgi:competence ComEA-like helix-hairpin-helix protein